MGRNFEIPNPYKPKKELRVKEGKRNQLEAELRKMFKNLDQEETRRKQPITRSGTGNIIRRRKGEKDKRLSMTEVPKSVQNH